MIQRIFDHVDNVLSAIVPLLYLIGLAAGTLAYFSGLIVDFNVAVGVCLAVAAECHSYLVQRRMRMARARLNRVKVSDEAYAQLEAQYTRQRNILIVLLLFSVYNSVQFVASTWTPTGWLPGPLQILVRGAIVPGLFYLAGELTPLLIEPADVLAVASRDMTFAAVRTMTQQWRRRLRRARKRNLDLAPIAVTLLHDAGDFPGAERIRRIAEGLSAAEKGRLPLLAIQTPPERPIEPSSPPPDDGGTPSASMQPQGETDGPDEHEEYKVLTLPAAEERDLVTASKRTPKQRVYDYLERHPRASVRTIERRCGVSGSTASKHWNTWRAEHGLPTETTRRAR